MLDVDLIREEAARRAARKESERDALARRLANGESLTPAEILDAVEACDWTLEGLQSAIEIGKKRERLRAVTATLPRLREQHGSLLTERETALEEFQTAEQKYRAAVAAIDPRIADVERQLDRAGEAAAELKTDTMAPRHLVELRRELQRDDAAISAKLENVRFQSSDAQLAAHQMAEQERLEAAIRAVGRGSDSQERRAGLEKELAELPSRISRRREYFQQLTQAREEVQSKIRQIEAEMLIA